VGAAAAGSLTSGSVTSGPMVGGPAANPGERAACANDLTASLTEDAFIGLVASQAPKRRLRS
jgi:hypothetical protein